MCDRNEVPEGCSDRVRDRADALGVLILGERCRPLCESALLRALSCLCARSPCLLCVAAWDSPPPMQYEYMESLSDYERQRRHTLSSTSDAQSEAQEKKNLTDVAVTFVHA